jgi:NADPH:quinone reductase-like Zn-dependent oxidoreductase
VTGVDNAGKLAFMRSVGADDVIDYRSDDFTRGGPYDLILDLVAYRSVFTYRRSLAPAAGTGASADRSRHCCAS